MNHKIWLSELEKGNSTYNCDYLQYNTTTAGMIYERLIEKGCFKDTEWGKESFIFRLTNRKSAERNFIPVPLQWRKTNVLLYIFLKELVPNDGKIWVKSNLYFLLNDNSPINPQTAKKQLQTKKRKKEEEKFINYLITGKEE